jgi:4'-phosphopantetheinyl transferase
VEAIATRFLPDDEAAWLSTLAPGARHAAFLRLWTRREAVLKARGCGFATGVGDAFAPIARGSATSADEVHTLTDLEVGPGYVGALAYHAPPTTLDIPDRALVRL